MEIEVIAGSEINTVDEKALKIGTPEFIKDLLIEFNKKRIWRSLSSLADTLGVDPQSLSGWLDCSHQFTRRAGKEKGILYYALSSRLDSNTEKYREEDGYALGMLHMVYFQLYKILKTYGLEINQRNAEAFSNLTISLDKLESGLLLFSKKTKASIEKLPKFN